MSRLLLLFVCGLCIVGCQDRATTTLGGANITFNGTPDVMKVVDDTAQVEIGTAKYDVAVQNGRLKVNGRDYGQVAADDEVKVSDGKVTINGRQAMPMTDSGQ
jgi:hypothetical protein